MCGWGDDTLLWYMHSCKMYTRGKPVRFGFKVWCLCSSGGYLYKFIPYAGRDDNYDKDLGLGANVVLQLLDVAQLLKIQNNMQFTLTIFYISSATSWTKYEKILCYRNNQRTSSVWKLTRKQQVLGQERAWIIWLSVWQAESYSSCEVEWQCNCFSGNQLSTSWTSTNS